MKKRVLSLLLALALMLSLAPAALAYDGQAQVRNELTAVHDGETAAYEKQAPSIVRESAPARRDTALLESNPDVTGWTEEIPWSGPVSELETQELYGAAISEEQVYQTINALRSTYYEGMYWTNESQKYTLSVPGYDEKDDTYYTLIGYGCVAFCYRLSDAAFGSSIARKVYNFTYDDIRVGDILRVNNDTHSVTVLQKFSDHVVLAEANYNSSVHWGRTMSRAEVMRSNYITTRYPANLTSLNVVVDKATVRPGEQVRVSVKSPLSTTYDIEVWKGDRGTGTMDWSAANVAPSASYLLTRYAMGVYTVYITSRNDDNQVISGTATFRVSDGMPFTDVSANAYYAGAVMWAADRGITTGTGDGTTFSPNDTVTRGEAVTFLWRAMGRPTSANWKNSFTDVNSSEFYYQAVVWAAANGVTTGVSDTEFEPDGAVTRGQMITFLWRAQGRPGATGQGEWYTDAEVWAYSNSLLTGTASAYATYADCPRSDVVYYMWNALT